MTFETSELHHILPSRKAEQTIEWVVGELEGEGIPTARGDAEIIVGHVLGLTRAEVQDGAATGRELDGEQLATVLDFTARRKQREPLQYLTGISLFRGIVLKVGPGVFIPRRETEYVTELAVQALRAAGVEDAVAVDVGAGAGAIALSIADEVPGSTVYGIEIEASAHEWMERNFRELAPGRSHAILGDMVGALPELDGRVDIVAGNPPWVPDGRVSPTPEVALFEKGARLYGGGADGLDVMRGLSRTALRWLKPGGTFITEHGISMGPQVRALLEADGWADVRTHVDPRGKERMTTAVRP
ncbi:MAG: peptide chain release factor N(5)-glutamine methyltransferase [Microbacteriaceae bacterium]|nr:peptide chain release factor N(5)-glutamine methyltransferase [Microbacteriaceae bacterium]